MDEMIISVLRGVIDPELKDNIVDLGMVKAASRDGNTAHVTVALTTAGCPLRHQIKSDVARKVATLEGIDDVVVTFGELTAEEKRTLMDTARKNARDNATPIAVDPTTRVIAVASGKGGVGKSSLTANLAAAIANEGFSVGVLDADIWGFSQPTMLGVNGRLGGEDGKITPHEKNVGKGKLKVVSMGFLVDDDQSALMWRGLILAKAVEQFLTDVAWGDLDYLLVDMPPGTGDIQMALARLVPQSEMLVVTTPARGAQKVAARVGDMAQRSFMPIIGVVENMSYFSAPDGTQHAIFGEGGGARLAKRLATQLIGQIPIEPEITGANSEGIPIVISESKVVRDSPAAVALRELAHKIVTDICPPVELATCTAHMAELIANIDK
ncbi:MAG TPA: P-loop NTPase [Acidimicrobiia bacterium]|nr:P-loop NTPase [Acidimicrobiia bacterium]